MGGISHITFMSADVDRAASFFRVALGAEELYDSRDGGNFSLSREKFLLVGTTWIAVMEGEAPQRRGYGHLAFKVAEGDFEGYLSRIERLGVEIRPGRERVAGEGRSVYFYDYDNHLFELHTGTLEERLSRYLPRSGKGGVCDA